MRNTSRKINLHRTSHSGSLNVILSRRSDKVELKAKTSEIEWDQIRTDIRLYSQVIYSDRDGEARFFFGGWKTRTTIKAVNTILDELGWQQIKIKNRNSTLYVTYFGEFVCEFKDGMSVLEMRELGEAVLKSILRKSQK